MNPWPIIGMIIGWITLVIIVATVVLLVWGTIEAIRRRRKPHITRVKKRRHPRG